MTAINRHTNRIANWLSRATFRNELSSLSDHALQDIGLARRQPAIDTCKPFWMA